MKKCGLLEVATDQSANTAVGVANCATTSNSSAPTGGFWSLVQVGAADECWPFIGHIDRDGYGKYHGHGAHREAFRLANGRTPEMSVLHSCDNPPCCNPTHLYEGTQQQNIADRVARRRSAAGARNGRYKRGLYVGGRSHPLKEVAS